jgi:hypothetical protein
MWNRLCCCLSGGHEYGVSCEPQAMFLRCIHCGKRSSGWALNGSPALHEPAAPPTGPVTRRPAGAMSRALSFPSS